MKLDLLNGKNWSPKPEMIRFYFDKKFLQVTISKGCAYYKLEGFEDDIENEDEIRSQLSYFTNVPCKRIFPSKF